MVTLRSFKDSVLGKYSVYWKSLILEQCVNINIFLIIDEYKNINMQKVCSFHQDNLTATMVTATSKWILT